MTDTMSSRRPDEVMLSVRDLVVEFELKDGARVKAVSGVSFDVRRGETLGIVGESGCGKTTVGKALVQLTRPASGSVLFSGHELTEARGDGLRRLRRRIQMVFQDPVSSLNPRRRIRDIVREPLKVWKDPSDHIARVDEALRAVGLDPERVGNRLPHQLSGGQCQRVSIARALMYGAELLVCDESVSALDVSVQAQILNLLEDAKRDFGLTLVFIAHDLAVVRNISDRIAVMYLGRICEIGDAAKVFDQPKHPYTRALLAAVPVPDPTRAVQRPELVGEPPSPVAPPSGCRFRTRCTLATELCAAEAPALRSFGADHQVACHYA